MQSILVATDGTPKAREAVELGVAIAASQQAVVTFLHAVPPTVWKSCGRGSPVRPVPRRPVGPGGRPAVPPKVPGAEHDEALRQAAAAAEAQDVNFRLELFAACTADVIVARARVLGAGLIVIGAEHASRLHRLAKGSITRSVLRAASCPVLVALAPVTEHVVRGHQVRPALGGLA
ncbi:MAG: universal stress protein [Actinomycetota bacterium]|nr:universal stress protein [Actinomycetota bacterium]